MRTRTRTDSTAGQRLDLSWDVLSTQGDQQDLQPSEEAFPAQASQDEAPLPSIQEDAAPADISEPSPGTEESSSAQHVQDEFSPMPETEPSNADIPAEDDQQQPPTGQESPAAPPSDADEKQDAASDWQPSVSDSPKVQESRSRLRNSRAAKQPTSILNDNSSLGKRLSKYREDACVSQEDLAKRLLVQVSVIKDLENGDYDSLFHSFRDNSIFVLATLKDICRELGVSKNSIEELEDIYYREITTSGHFAQDSKPQHINDRTKDGTQGNFKVGTKEPIIKKLPQILVFTLILALVAFFFISIVMPYIRHSRKEPDKKFDFAPLVTPEKSTPMQLQIP